LVLLWSSWHEGSSACSPTGPRVKWSRSEPVHGLGPLRGIGASNCPIFGWSPRQARRSCHRWAPPLRQCGESPPCLPSVPPPSSASLPPRSTPGTSHCRLIPGYRDRHIPIASAHSLRVRGIKQRPSRYVAAPHSNPRPSGRRLRVALRTEVSTSGIHSKCIIVEPSH